MQVLWRSEKWSFPHLLDTNILQNMNDIFVILCLNKYIKTDAQHSFFK